MTPLGPGMAAELRKSPEAVERQAEALGAVVADLAKRLKRRPPQVVVTCARGSSAHAATFVKHLIERHLGIPVAAAAPNIATIYHRPLELRDQLFLAISQSGLQRRSDRNGPHGASGRRTHGRDSSTPPSSPLAAACETVLPIAAGPELSVAATKTFVASLAALLRLTAMWTDDAAIRHACDRLPERLAEATRLDWSEGLGMLAKSSSLVTIGRGPTLAIAREAALELKEICTLHAEAFSSAEFRHGPIALVSRTYPILVLAPTDEAAPGISDLIADLRRDGACVLVAAAGERTTGVLSALARRAAGRRRHLPHSELLRFPRFAWRSAAAPMSSIPAICRK